MQKATELAKIIQSGLTADHSEVIAEYGMIDIFLPIYNGPEKRVDKNKLICYIVHAYNPDSKWLDLRKDRIDNKTKILSNLEADPKSDLYQGVIKNTNEICNISIFKFLEELKDWRWRSIFDLLDYAAKMSRFAAMETSSERKYEKVSKDGQSQTYTEEIDLEKVTKINKEKGVLIDSSIDARNKASALIEQLRKEYVNTDNAVQQDFGFSFTETSKSKDVLSWRKFINETRQKGIQIR